MSWGESRLIVKLDCCETKTIFSRDHKLSWLFSEQNACGSQAATLVRNFDHCLVCIIASDAVIIPWLLDWRCYFKIQSTQIISQWISVGTTNIFPFFASQIWCTAYCQLSIPSYPELALQSKSFWLTSVHFNNACLSTLVSI